MSALVRLMNQKFVDCLDSDMAKARMLVIDYVLERARNHEPCPEEVACQFDFVANIVRLTVRMKMDGHVMSGDKEWTTMELLTADELVTKLFDKALDSVFEAPSEGAPVS